jgi:nitrous oxide reductase accessory protein NosL
MLVAPHGDWLAQIVFDRGQALFFDGAKDLLRYHLDPDRFEDAPAVKKRGILFVTSYYDRKLIRARDAFFVIGSDVLGPMGPELIPLASREAAEEFQRDHGGSAILAFDDVTAELMSAMR